MSFGQTPHSDPICTAMRVGKGWAGNQGPAATRPSDRSAGGDCLRLASVPVAYFRHSLAGALFGVLGPLQFVISVAQPVQRRGESM